MRSPRARTLLFTLLAAAGIVSIGGGAHAGLTSPGGGTHRGDIVLREDRGGVAGPGCSFADSIIGVRRDRDDATVLFGGKGSAGGWETTWDTHGAEIGSYTATSIGQDFEYDATSESCGGHSVPLSSQTFRVENQAALAEHSVPHEKHYGEDLPAIFKLTNAATGYPVVGASLTFTIVGDPIDEPITTTDITTPAGTGGVLIGAAGVVLEPGDYTITASFARDCCFMGTLLEVPIKITKRPAKLEDLSDTTAQWKCEAIMVATLTDELTGVPLAGRTVTFTLGVATENTATDERGVAGTFLNPTEVPGTPVVTKSSFAGDEHYLPVSAQADFSIDKRKTDMFLTSPPANGYWDEDLPLAAGLIDTSVCRERDVPAGSIRFTLTAGGTPAVADAPMDENADASTTLGTHDAAPGTGSLRASFAGDAYFESSDDSVPFELKKRPVSIEYTGDHSVVAGADATLRAVVTDTRKGAAPSVPAPVRFSVGERTFDAATDGAGEATRSFTATFETGRYVLRAAVPTNAYYVETHVIGEFFVSELAFVDDLGRGTVFLSPGSRDFRLETPDGRTGIKHDDGMAAVAGVIALDYADDELTFAGGFASDGGAFTSAGLTAFGVPVRELHGV